MLRALSSRPQLSVISGEPDPTLDRLAACIAPSVRVRDRGELDALLEGLGELRDAGADVAPKTLDLIGHAAARTSLLRLGDWVLDACEPGVIGWLRQLAARDVLPRLGVHTVRLLGCGTAATPEGRATLGAMAAILGIEVVGATQLLYHAHYGPDGFRPACAFLLAGVRDRPRSSAGTARGPRGLAIDHLPSVPAPPRSPYPTRIASGAQALELLALVQPGSGAPMPAYAAPRCALAWPAASGGYHVAHVLLDGAFLQVYPEGLGAPGIAFAVDQPAVLCQLLEALPSAELPPAELPSAEVIR